MPQELSVREELEQLQPQFKHALTGTGIPPERFILVITTALRLNPDLRNCDKRSLLNAAMKAATDGLVPDGNDGALVPFDGKVTWMPMVGGIRKKIRRAGEVTNWDVTVVHAKDKFDYELGDTPWIKHKPWNPGPLEQGTEETDEAYNARRRRHVDAGPLTHVYSVANIKGGGRSRDVMTRVEVELVRDQYARKNRKGEFSPAWRRSFDEMAKKTIARRHAKQLPMSTDLLNLLTRDDELYDVERERGDRIQAPGALNDRLELLSRVDSETGEFLDPDGGVSTPPPQSAASDDVSSVVGDGRTEEAAQPSNSGANLSPAPEEHEAVTHSPASQAPPGAPAKTPSQAPGGSRNGRKTAPKPDLLSSIEERGADMARKGRAELERWVNELPPDEMAKISLAQLKAWRLDADKAAV